MGKLELGGTLSLARSLFFSFLAIGAVHVSTVQSLSLALAVGCCMLRCVGREVGRWGESCYPYTAQRDRASTSDKKPYIRLLPLVTLSVAAVPQNPNNGTRRAFSYATPSLRLWCSALG